MNVVITVGAVKGDCENDDLRDYKKMSPRFIKEEATSKLDAGAIQQYDNLARLADKWPAPRLMEIWNTLPGVTPVKKFTSRGWRGVFRHLGRYSKAWIRNAAKEGAATTRRPRRCCLQCPRR